MRRAALLLTVVLLVPAGAAEATPGDTVRHPFAWAEVADLEVGPDGALWATAFTEDRVVRVDPDTEEATVYAAPGIETPVFLAVVGDDVWFSNDSDGLGRIDTLADTVELVPDLTSSRILDLAAGPDGRLWYLAEGDTHVFAMDVEDHSVEVYGGGDELQQARQLAADPDGERMWVATNRGLVSVDIDDGDVDAAFASFPGTELVVTPDGDHWQITTSSRIGTYHHDSTSGDVDYVDDGHGLFDLTIGPDGDLWGVFPDRLVRIDPDTLDVDVAPLPRTSAMTEPRIASGDGRLWVVYAEQLLEVEVTAPDETDTTDPVVDLRVPTHDLRLDADVRADFGCTDGTTLVSCTGHTFRGALRDGGRLPTRPLGPHFFSVTARDAAGNTQVVTQRYEVFTRCLGRRVDVVTARRQDPTDLADVILATEPSEGLDGDDRMCGRERLDGGRGDDQLLGDRTWDRLYGGPGDDVLDGGPGFDICVGGRGHDVFRNCEQTRQE